MIAFNKANAASEMALFGQETFERAEKTKGLTDPAYLKARGTSLAAAGPNGIDKMMREHGSTRWSGRRCRRRGRSTRCTVTRSAAAARAALRRSRDIRTSPCRWGRSRGCRSG